ncbi:hypothetical protein Nepgr_016680 [Nepenthes gracilis]|uniref:Uncharacterized protein n=1 Tax=Nepenthes gracilis TaxID=150966 RepID=A0AAD3SQ57_NEPGR|nr:hypothetical protein Nepgr_016680 [Nepenthes gracilis]
MGGGEPLSGKPPSNLVNELRTPCSWADTVLKSNALLQAPLKFYPSSVGERIVIKLPLDIGDFGSKRFSFSDVDNMCNVGDGVPGPSWEYLFSLRFGLRAVADQPAR